MVYKSKKIPRVVRDRNRRVAHNRKEKRFATIIREEPPKGKAKIISREEMIKDPQTGKAKLQTVYEVKKEKNPHLKPEILYIPKVPPEKERKYLRKELPQFKNPQIRYPNVDKYGDLKAIKKSRLIEIAKTEYDLNEKGVKYFDKDDLIKYLEDRSKGKIKAPEQYIPNKVRLARIEPIRNEPIRFKIDPSNPYNSQIAYGKISVSGNQVKRKSAVAVFNKMLEKNPKWANVPKIGETRPFDETIHKQFMAGLAPTGALLSEIMLHTDLPDRQKTNLMYLEPAQLGKIYKKLYKASIKPEKEKFNQVIRLPEFDMTNVPKYAKAPKFKDPKGKSHVVGSKPFPYAINPLLPYDYDIEYN